MTVLKPYKGYTFSREIHGQVIPQSVQNLVIRSYAQKNELDFFLKAKTSFGAKLN